jgi:hypothetical protein
LANSKNFRFTTFFAKAGGMATRSEVKGEGTGFQLK